MPSSEPYKLESIGHHDVSDSLKPLELIKFKDWRKREGGGKVSQTKNNRLS